MNLIGENYLFEINLLLTQPLCQIDCLAEWHVTIIIAMNQQTGDFQVATLASGDDSKASFSASF